MYNFTELAVQLNEPESNVAPTDSRLRPDQRLMEEAKWDQANQEKLRLEEKQRSARKRKEAAEQALLDPQQGSNEQDQSSLLSSNTNEDNLKSDANWFQKVVDPFTKQPIHVFTNEYWDCKIKQDWKRCPDIF
jgi:oxysterol-binding protein 1